MVSCDPFDGASVYTSSPILVVEILSTSTAAVDGREKLVAYRQLQSLREYVIVHQRTRRVELYRKDHEERWQLTDLGSGDELVLEAIPEARLAIPVEAIYANVSYPGQADPDLEVREDAAEFLAEEIDW